MVASSLGPLPRYDKSQRIGKGGFASVRWQFMAGILLAALGGFLVTRYKPGDAPPAKATPQSQTERHEPLQ